MRVEEAGLNGGILTCFTTTAGTFSEHECHNDIRDSVVSNETHIIIKSYPREKIEQNKALRQKLNKLLLQDMTEQMFIKMFGKSDDVLFTNIMSIQPCSSELFSR